MTWHYLNYILGLLELGHDVYYVEDSDDYPSCLNPRSGVYSVDPTEGLLFASRAFAQVGLDDRWAYYDAHDGTWKGARAQDARVLCETADLLLNVSGVNPLRDWLQRVPKRVFVDTDPGFTQIRHLSEDLRCARAKSHNVYFTFGANIGRTDCLIPDDGFSWQVTRQPVSLHSWYFTPGRSTGHYSTVMSWHPFGDHSHGQLTLRTKSASFPPFTDLPSRVSETFELALSIGDAPLAALTRAGWRLADVDSINDDPAAYQAYVRSSKGEFGIAKEGYVATRCGWFSERSAAYLASGRPVLAQDTGFGEWLPTGEGLFSFSSSEDVANVVSLIESRYDAHCRAARVIAVEYFGARHVLSQLIENTMRSPLHHPRPLRAVQPPGTP